MQNVEKFWDQAAEKYAKRPVSDVKAYEYTLDRTRSYLKPTDYVVEVGCGTGSTALVLAPSVASILGTDVAANMIEIAKRKATAEGISNARFQKAEVFDRFDKPQKPDVILALNLLHLMEDPSAVIRSLGSNLGKGGLLISKTACLSPKKWLFGPLIKGMQFFNKAPFVNFLAVTQLEAMIRDAGFEILESGNYPEKTISRYVVARKI